MLASSVSVKRALLVLFLAVSFLPFDVSNRDVCPGGGVVSPSLSLSVPGVLLCEMVMVAGASTYVAHSSVSFVGVEGSLSLI